MPSYFTSESVRAGHPDKVCDQISDAIVDALLAQDPKSHVAVETAVTANRIFLLGEVQSSAKVDFAQIARQEVKRLGYDYRNAAFHHQDLEIGVYIREQSSEIAAGVDDAGEGEGAGDQGMMFGYACRETPQLMPLPITLAHELTRAIDDLYHANKQDLRPDGKAQVTVEYKDGQPVAVHHVVAAVPHAPHLTLSEVKALIYDHAVKPVLAGHGYKINPDKQFVLNGTGIWHDAFGPAADAGLTGRKIVVDTYGGYARVGGGAFSGKDPSKVDRSGAYAARYLAKNIVAAGLADKAEVSLAYFIGARRPVMQQVDTFGTAKVSDAEIQDYMDSLLDTSVRGIIKGLKLQQPIYRQTAVYGHFGRPEFPWEQVVGAVKM